MILGAAKCIAKLQYLAVGWGSRKISLIKILILNPDIQLRIGAPIGRGGQA